MHHIISDLVEGNGQVSDPTPKLMPADAKLVVTAHFDNSRANRFNPDPTAEVRWGDQSWEEMLIEYYGTMDPATARSAQPRTGQQQQQ